MKKNIVYLFCALLTMFCMNACSTSKKSIKIKSQVPAGAEFHEPEQRQRDYYFYEAIRMKENQQYDEAIETLLLCEAIDPTDGGVQSELGMLYGLVGLKDETIVCMEKAVEIQPDNWWYNIRLIGFYTENKYWDRAIELTTNLQKRYPNKETVYTILATLYMQNKEYEKAITAFDKLEAFNGIQEEISMEKFRLYFVLGKSKKAFAEIDRLINKYPTESRYKVLLGNMYMHQEQPEKAFEIYQQVLAEDPTNPHVYVSLSEYYESKSQPEQAMDAIVNALKSDKLDIDTKMEILGQYVQQLSNDSTKLAETESLLKLLVDRYPLEEQVHAYYAIFLQIKERNEEAISELETMLNINSKNQHTWMQLIQLYFSDKDYESMLKTTEKAIQILPDFPQWYLYQGIAYFQLENYHKAVTSYRKGLELVPLDQLALRGDFYSQIADSYFKLNNKEEAFLAYEEALKDNPANVYVMNNYAYYLSVEKKDLRKAERMSAKTLEREPNNSTYLDTYAWILYEQGNYTLAKFYIERAIDNLDREEERGVLFDHYGDILWMLKQDEKAMEMWEKAYEAGPKTEELKLKIETKGWPRTDQ